jgi:adenylylsulfate kinase
MINSKSKTHVIWLTGLPSSGKTTISNRIVDELLRRGMKAELLDGDEVRKIISSELGFSKADREIHARRVIYLSKLLSRNGIIVVVALISPYRSIREEARKSLENFIEIWVKCSLQTCLSRDPKGLYKKAKEGKVTNLSGMQDPYEPPEHPEIILDTEIRDPEECCRIVLEYLSKEIINV